MDRVLMIADDLTGALDAGIAFRAAGVRTCVGRGDYFLREPAAAECGAVVSVVPSRHVPAEESYRMVYDAVSKAAGQGFTCIYKKTDSALRGNVGAELTAAMDAAGEKRLYFAPAFPAMDRVTRGGIQYIDGDVPVAESVFGSDPFNPVKHSSVSEIIAETCGTPVIGPGDLQPDGITLYDAGSREDLLAAARDAFRRRGAVLAAGCAGFASVLPEVLDLERDAQGDEKPGAGLMVFCGSVNPISLQQCRRAAEGGAPHFRLIEDGRFLPEGGVAEKMARAAAEKGISVMDTGALPDSSDPDPAGTGRAVAERMSLVISAAADMLPDAAVFVIGGDTLIALTDRLGTETLYPERELLPGVVLFRYVYRGQTRHMISKSGGFGGPDLIAEVREKLCE